jgi:hypothetical protein
MKTAAPKSAQKTAASNAPKSVAARSPMQRLPSRIGNRALGQLLGGPGKPLASTPAAHTPVVQRKNKVPETVGPNDFGQFETTRFDPLNDSGVDIVLMFHPNRDKADAKKIALTQSVKATTDKGVPYAISPTNAARMVTGKQGKGYTIDASGATNNPLFYDTKNLGAQDDLSATPESNVTTGAIPDVGTNTHYLIGHCYKDKPTDKDKKVGDAGINDKPQGIQTPGYGMTFETAALAIEGVDKGKYYGSVKWGYKIGGTKKNPKVEANKDTTDISQASTGTPTANFREAAKLWNAATTTGTLEVTPPKGVKDAFVQKVSGTVPNRLAQGTKLKFNRAIKGTVAAMIEAEILDSNGQGTGNVVNIYVDDVKDLGGGTPNKPLP